MNTAISRSCPYAKAATDWQRVEDVTIQLS